MFGMDLPYSIGFCCINKKYMSMGLAQGWGKRSVSRMMLILKFLVKVFSNSFKTS